MQSCFCYLNTIIICKHGIIIGRAASQLSHNTVNRIQLLYSNNKTPFGRVVSASHKMGSDFFENLSVNTVVLRKSYRLIPPVFSLETIPLKNHHQFSLVEWVGGEVCMIGSGGGRGAAKCNKKACCTMAKLNSHHLQPPGWLFTHTKTEHSPCLALVFIWINTGINYIVYPKAARYLVFKYKHSPLKMLGEVTEKSLWKKMLEMYRTLIVDSLGV